MTRPFDRPPPEKETPRSRGRGAGENTKGGGPDYPSRSAPAQAFRYCLDCGGSYLPEGTELVCDLCSAWHEFMYHEYHAAAALRRFNALAAKPA